MLKPVGERKDNDTNQDNSNQASGFQDNSYEVMFVNGQLVCLPPASISNYLMLIYITCFMICCHWPWNPAREIAGRMKVDYLRYFCNLI